MQLQYCRIRIRRPRASTGAADYSEEGIFLNRLPQSRMPSWQWRTSSEDAFHRLLLAEVIRVAVLSVQVTLFHFFFRHECSLDLKTGPLVAQRRPQLIRKLHEHWIAVPGCEVNCKRMNAASAYEKKKAIGSSPVSCVRTTYS